MNFGATAGPLIEKVRQALDLDDVSDPPNDTHAKVS